MRIEVYTAVIDFMIKYKEFRRAAEKFKKDEDSQQIYFTYRCDDGFLYDDAIFVRRIAPNCYEFA